MHNYYNYFLIADLNPDEEWQVAKHQRRIKCLREAAEERIDDNGGNNAYSGTGEGCSLGNNSLLI